MSRTMRSGSGAILDPQARPTSEVGGVYMKAAYNVGAKIATQRTNRSVGPSLYDGASNDSVWSIAPGEFLFTQPGVRSSSMSSKDTTEMEVLGTINGIGALATARFANDPRARDIVRLAAKNQIQYVGTAYQHLEYKSGDTKRGITVQLGGLRTLPLGNGKFGEESAIDNILKPGDLVCVDMPMPGREGRAPGPGSQARLGIPDDRYTLQMRRCSPHTSGHALLLVIYAILKDPLKWKGSFGQRLAGTNAWASAASELFNSYLVGGLLFNERMLALGLQVPSARGQMLARDGGISTALQTAAAIANTVDSPAALTPSQKRTLEQSSSLFTGHLAEILNVVDSREYTSVGSGFRDLNGSSNTASKEVYATARTLRMEILQRIFYSGGNAAFEFGLLPAGDNTRAESMGRFNNTGSVKGSTTAGAMLQAQLQHIPRAVAGFHRAILDDMRFMIGKAATGATQFGSGKAHIFLSKFT